jgi:hypothetical protein
VFLAHQEARQRQRYLSLTHTSRAEEQETPAWTTGLRQPEFATPKNGNNARQHVILAANALPEVRFQFVQFSIRWYRRDRRFHRFLSCRLPTEKLFPNGNNYRS